MTQFIFLEHPMPGTVYPLSWCLGSEECNCDVPVIEENPDRLPGPGPAPEHGDDPGFDVNLLLGVGAGGLGLAETLGVSAHPVQVSGKEYKG